MWHLHGLFEGKPHIAFKVKNIEEESKGLKLLFGPIKIDDSLRLGTYQYEDGMVIELMERS